VIDSGLGAGSEGGERPGAITPRTGVPAEGVGGSGRLAEGSLVERAAPAGRGVAAPGQSVFPLGGVATRPPQLDHRRPDFLLDDADAFADDRWFTPPVIGGGDEDADV
jgi:hypothetical protein